SSTTMISRSWNVWLSTEFTVSAMKCSALYAGMITDTCGMWMSSAPDEIGFRLACRSRRSLRHGFTDVGAFNGRGLLTNRDSLERHRQGEEMPEHFLVMKRDEAAADHECDHRGLESDRVMTKLTGHFGALRPAPDAPACEQRREH